MKPEEVLSKTDHTILKAFTSWEDIETLCEEAIKYNTASVCVPPCYVKRIKDKYGDKIVICTVVGFPLGYTVTDAKIAEAKKVIEDGADEIDMVLNITDVKNKDYDRVTAEIRSIKEAAGDKVLKVIIETCYLDEEEKIGICKCVTDSGADYIKTSTGFGTAGARLEDIELFKKHIGPGVRIKAAGGINTKEEHIAFIEAGTDRLGSSKAVSLFCDILRDDEY